MPSVQGVPPPDALAGSSACVASPSYTSVRDNRLAFVKVASPNILRKPEPMHTSHAIPASHTANSNHAMHLDKGESADQPLFHHEIPKNASHQQSGISGDNSR